MSNTGEPLFSDFETLLKFMELYAKVPLEGPLDPQLEQQLAQIEDQMEEFKKSLAPELVKTVDPRNLTPKEKRLISKWGELGITAVGMATALEVAKESRNVDKKSRYKKNTRQMIQERKKKFKGVGGNKKWQKL